MTTTGNKHTQFLWPSLQWAGVGGGVCVCVCVYVCVHGVHSAQTLDLQLVNREEA